MLTVEIKAIIKMLTAKIPTNKSKTHPKLVCFDIEQSNCGEILCIVSNYQEVIKKDFVVWK